MAAAVIRPRSIKEMTLAILEIRGEHVHTAEEVIITGRAGTAVTVEHANGWTRTLTAESVDARQLRDPSCKSPSVTFRLLELADAAA